MTFEIRAHDGLGRVGFFSVNKKSIYTPNLAVVVNPNELIIPADEMVRDFGVDLLITNAYIIKGSRHAKSIESKGLHDFFNFPGIIYTDSGTYQMFSKGKVDITNDETLAYQKLIKSDIHTPLDLFTTPDVDRVTAEYNLKETVKRVKGVSSINFSAPIQGGSFLDLRARACKELSKVNPTVYPIGGIVPLMIKYQFKELIKVIIECKKHLPLGVPVHAFGAGHPLIFALLAYAGVDLFDSASYALYAREGKYITETGTKHLKELITLPCDCPICSKYEVKDFNEGLLARHNLHALMREVRLVRSAIQEGRLFELAYSRAMSHPAVYEAFTELLKHNELLAQNDPVRKSSALFYSGELSALRPEIYYASSKIAGLIPEPLRLVYPFGQNVGWPVKFSKKKFSDYDTLRVVIDYQFGKGAGDLLIKGDERIIKSSNYRINQVFNGDNLLFVLRASDGYLALHKAGVSRIKKFVKNVFANEEFAQFYRDGGSVFAKHVIKADAIKPGEEVLVYCGKELVAFGEAVLSSKEMIDCSAGMAVKVRSGI